MQSNIEIFTIIQLIYSNQINIEIFTNLYNHYSLKEKKIKNKNEVLTQILSLAKNFRTI